MPIVPRRSRRRAVKTSGRWTEDERQHLWFLRSQHSTLPWGRFHEQFFPNRSLNALQKAYSIMSLEKKKSDMTDTPKIHGRVVKRPLSDTQDDQPWKQTKRTTDIPFEKSLVEETDDSASSDDESSSSGSESDSDEETPQEPTTSHREKSTPAIETAPGEEAANNDVHQEEETTDPKSPKVAPTKVVPAASPTIENPKPLGVVRTEQKINPSDNHSTSSKVSSHALPPPPVWVQIMNSATRDYRIMDFKIRDAERVASALQEEVDTLKQLNEGKEDKIAALQEDVRKHLQTIRRLQQDENRHTDEMTQQRSANQILSDQIDVLEKKLIIARSQNKCETCARVRELTSRMS
ncbi:hypothetical protein BO94DRAFT_571789 [Aspergillus sclerotioniger CBS 115572]|uniref:Uncharacterized protein n=1 Tax=Aspergillus sclerotioniger CBS 115572 TaxID=1450535 RepID=A0A317XC48_9EURO|nr:hypothetical protein BO94DRAFT_571789 [Aspergillus sclerotioniger CBS 115572]PWY95187.1 hypothetical protein BO94DRAFT_571789 [Aspergillus sclerotioniger CBS 115572]